MFTESRQLMKYILDGYNILFQERNTNGSLEEQRVRLFEKWNLYAEELHLDLTVVLDAHLQEGELRRHHFHRLEIIYTDFAQTADDWIIDYVENAPCHKRRQLTVVTSDRSLMQKIRLEQVEVLSVPSFFKEIEKKTHSRLLKEEKTPRPKLLQEKKKCPIPLLSDDKSWIALFENRMKRIPSSTRDDD